MKPIFRLGTAKVDITPKTPVALAGFKERKGPFEAISHPLYLRVLFFQLEDVNGSLCQSVLVSADLIWWDTCRAKNLRERIAEKWGMVESAVILHATHTHSGPQTSDQFTPSLGAPNFQYLQYLEEQLMNAIKSAYENMESVSIERGVGKCEIGVHRRKLNDGKVVMAPNPDGPIDSEVNVICFQTHNQEMKAIITHYTCHPTTTGDNFVSSEYPGVAMDMIEHHFKGNTLALFLQGCSGDIRPALEKDGVFYKGTDKEVRQLGRILAEEVLSIMRKPMNQLTPSMKSGMLQADLLFRDLPTVENLKGISTEPNVMAEWSTLLLERPYRINAEIPLEVSYLELADSLAFLAMNAEVVVEYGIWIKSCFAGKVLPIPYSNGMIGYIPTAIQTEEGGYEAEESTYYFGLPSPFSATIEKQIKNTIMTLTGGRPLIKQPIKRKKVDQLNVEVYENRKDMGNAAGVAVANKMRELLSKQDRIHMIFASAPSQNEFLEQLRQEKEIDWSRVTAFHMDEYIGLPKDSTQLFSRYIEEHLFSFVHPGEVHFIDSTNSISEECKRYKELISQAPIDIVCLGIGENGHIAFNDPPVADFQDPEVIKPVELDELCRQQQVNDGCFSEITQVPTHALTLTIPTLVSGSFLYCMVPGKTKYNAVQTTLYEDISTSCPASRLREHSNCTLYLDQDSYGVNTDE